MHALWTGTIGKDDEPDDLHECIGDSHVFVMTSQCDTTLGAQINNLNSKIGYCFTDRSTGRGTTNLGAGRPYGYRQRIRGGREGGRVARHLISLPSSPIIPDPPP